MIVELPKATEEQAVFLVIHHLTLAALHFEILDEEIARTACMAEVAKALHDQPGLDAAEKFITAIDATFSRLAEDHDHNDEARAEADEARYDREQERLKALLGQQHK